LRSPAEAPASPVATPSLLPRLTLVLGGARSGKSRYAEGLIAAAGARTAVYLATAEAGDAEMAERIRRHRERRAATSHGVAWETAEAPRDLVGRLADLARPGRPVLVDCLTLWLSNLMLAGNDLAAETGALVAALPALGAPVVLVANEVGLGIVPENALARAFRDHAGQLNQAMAAIADRVVFMAAGLPLALKDLSPVHGAASIR
jgi:adenosylcobinamide kinase / adenosylcobinamide-phosphate guanylyltransferase